MIYGTLPKRKCVECIQKYTDLNAIKTIPEEKM